MEKHLFENKKHHFTTYLLIGIILSIFTTTYFAFFHTTRRDKANRYTICNHILNSSIPVCPKKKLNDQNVIHLLHAQRNGIAKPFATNAEFDSLIHLFKKKMILYEVKESRLYHFKELDHSHPYLIPEAIDMIDEIAFRFQNKLKEKELGKYCFFLTSMLRTEETQSKLSRRNRNAAQNTAHYYGTTVDISYKDFYNLDDDVVEAKRELTDALKETLIEMREECKMLALRERKQACFHITVVVCKPEETEKEEE